MLECFVPLRTAVQIGADEGFEVAKATLCLKGHRLYTEIWNDQPPLHTFLVTQTLARLSPSILGPRLITIAFSMVLIASLFLAALRVNGLAVATIMATLVLGSPGFVELSSSCMLEIPALATAIAAVCLLVVAPPGKWRLKEIACGFLFGAAVLMKLVPVILMGLLPLIL